MKQHDQQSRGLVKSEEDNQLVDGCGCGQSPSALRRSITDSSVAPAGPPETRPRRAVKLVITLRPDEGTGYHAVLAVGAEGCDPLLRSIAVVDLPAALDEVPGLLADAEARWQVQPRYPATAPAPSRRATPAVAAPVQRSGQRQPLEDAPASTPSATPVPAATPAATRPGVHPASPDQLSLFT